jgi:hypothetical protein
VRARGVVNGWNMALGEAAAGRLRQRLAGLEELLHVPSLSSRGL